VSAGRVSAPHGLRAVVERALAAADGILRLQPAWVARDWLPPGRRLPVPDARYDVAERGFICERWLGSTTRADNRVGPDDEGLSYVAIDGHDPVTLAAAVACAGPEILGEAYAATHAGLGRLAKIFDFGARIPYHIHPPRWAAAKVGRNPKEEAYYFPAGIDMGPHPESFFGVHPSIARGPRAEALLPYLRAWDSDLILRHARAYLQVAGEGFHVPSGVLHAPGTALTVELQEDSDALAMLQALNAGRIIDRELLFKDVSAAEREAAGEHAVLEWIDWETNGDPLFYENRHLAPRLVAGSEQAGGEEHWLFHNSSKFSGKRVTVRAGASATFQDAGVHTLLVWQGRGRYGGVDVEGGTPGLDELLVAHSRALRPLEVVNTAQEDLVVLKFFGPDVNPDVPRVAEPQYGGESDDVE
jgi:mannose-6-phosphate isomerase class I